MTLSGEEVSKAATDLFIAEKSGIQTGLLSLAHPGMTLDDAYAVQAALVEMKRASGLKIIGRKIGLTSRAMQEALKITTPDSGVLFDNMLFHDGDIIGRNRFIQPRIEAEIAFVMKSPLSGSSVTRDDIIEATDYICPSLEILDTRIVRADLKTGKSRIITDTVSDNAANAGIVLGRQCHQFSETDLRWVGSIVKRDGIVEETGLGAGVLDDPVTSMLWLVHRLSKYDDGLSAGDIVLSGSFIRPIEATPGSSFDADFGTFGSVRIDFE